MKNNDNVYDVVIIGAGVAGLHAGFKLKNEGYNVLIVEADSVIGGRCRQDMTFTQYPVELGGELMHGGDTYFVKLAQEQKWETFEVFSEDLFDSPKKSTYFYLGRERKLIRQDEIDDDITTLFQAFQEMHQSIDLSNPNDGKDTNLLEYLVKQGVPYRVLGLADCIYSKTWGTNLDRIGLREAVREDKKAHQIQKNFKLQGSNRILVDHLSKGQNILLNYRVSMIDYSNSIIFIQGPSQSSQSKILCKKVIVTVPLAILKENDIKFLPELPERKRDALSVFGMDGGMKIICKFNRKFWLQNCELVLCADSAIPQIWMDGAPNRKVPQGKDAEFVTVGFITGDQAISISSLSPLYQIKAMLDQLDAMFGTPQDWTPASSSYISHITYDWKKNPYVRGAYSYPSIVPSSSYKYTESPSHILSEPLHERVYFAGEHTATEYELSTLNGALETGKRVYNEIIQTISPKPNLQSKM
ncbi:putative amino oxidase [Tieghemostelium lacteum]|uniref:Putative amino oxidase n=1 Tax=Tieghemostelium lacteum TaxID=361077 RepID=A0A152A9F8_TIELA|nr:putative amino oxidase [Tieghemostelium lacteum]|eukprot:KYR02697.1 putative amino oxidase [Tieghemostelium lacteum]